MGNKTVASNDFYLFCSISDAYWKNWCEECWWLSVYFFSSINNRPTLYAVKLLVLESVSQALSIMILNFCVNFQQSGFLENLERERGWDYHVWLSHQQVTFLLPWKSMFWNTKTNTCFLQATEPQLFAEAIVRSFDALCMKSHIRLLYFSMEH